VTSAFELQQDITLCKGYYVRAISVTQHKWFHMNGIIIFRYNVTTLFLGYYVTTLFLGYYVITFTCDTIA